MFTCVGVIVIACVDDAATSRPTGVNVIQPDVKVAPSSVMSLMEAICPSLEHSVLGTK